MAPRDSETINWIDCAPPGKVTEINVLLSPRAAPGYDVWPGMRSMNTRLVGRFDLDGGATVWVVYHEPDAPDIQQGGPGSGSFFRGKGPSDATGNGLRMIAFGDAPDGSRVMFEGPVDISTEALANMQEAKGRIEPDL